MTEGQRLAEAFRASYRPHHDCDCWGDRQARWLINAVDSALNHEREACGDILRRIVMAIDAPKPSELFIFGRVYDAIIARKEGHGKTGFEGKSVADMLKRNFTGEDK